MMTIVYEFGGAIFLVIAIALLWIAKPVDGQPALFLRKKRSVEVAYALVVLFCFAGGVAGVLLGLTA